MSPPCRSSYENPVGAERSREIVEKYWQRTEEVSISDEAQGKSGGK
jgi:hypothetical protein